MIDEPVEADRRDYGRYRRLPSGIAWTRRPTIGWGIRTAVHKSGVRSVRLLAGQKAQLFGVLPRDRSFAVATQKGVE
jgi:hypothetical protein